MTLLCSRLYGLASVLTLVACAEARSGPQAAVETPPQSSPSISTTATPALPVEPVARRRMTIDPSAAPLVSAARDRLKSLVIYDGRYIGLDYPGGDVPATIGVCTDVVIRSYRAAHGFDLQKAVHEDMRANFAAYPTNWGLTRPDKNIDHRRVPNLETWFSRAGYDIPISYTPPVYKPGDIVSWRLDGRSGQGGLPHIGIVSDRLARDGTPLIIHNIGGGVEESNILFNHTIKGHFRFVPAQGAN